MQKQLKDGESGVFHFPRKRIAREKLDLLFLPLLWPELREQFMIVSLIRNGREVNKKGEVIFRDAYISWHASNWVQAEFIERWINK